MLKITLIAVGNKMPLWVQQAAGEYTKRLKDKVNLTIIEIPLLKRSKITDLPRVLEKEALAIKDAIPRGSKLIILAVNGKQYTSEELADKISTLQQTNSHLCFLIGGPEGIKPEILALSKEHWSLSKLTLPHTLARINLLETLYRAWTIINNHPYHNA